MRFLLSLSLALALSASAVAAQTSKYGIPSSSPAVSGAVQLPSTTIGALPTCDVSHIGVIRMVTDATTPTVGGAAVGGGAVATLVMCKGTGWVTP